MTCWWAGQHARHGEPERLARRLRRRLVLAGSAVNGVAAFMVATYLLVVFPPTEEASFVTWELGLAATGLYVLGASIFAGRRARRLLHGLRQWLLAERPPTPEERRDTLRLPKRFALMSFGLWMLATPTFALPALDVSVDFALEVGAATALAGLTAAAGVYLFDERILRPATALALDPEAPPDTRSLGIGPRLLLTWLLCSGVPLVMIALIPLGREVSEPRELVAPILFAVAAAFCVGLLAMKLATAAVTRPVGSLRRAVDRVRDGDLDASVAVDDGSELGRLQAGFNAMLAGLRERERLHDLFGRHVGPDVAREALEREPSLGGQTRTVSALFVDVVGSTALAEREPAERVVALLNRFFETVVSTVDEHGGLVNKFEGDAALCVFGAPIEQRDHADRALAAARALRARLDAAGDGLDAAIGVACGDAVAGYVGAESRFEYTVIGDPVNEASRLTELAKQRPGRLLASAPTVEHAGEAEASHWAADGDVVLRGRRAPTRLAVPAAEPAAEAPDDALGLAGSWSTPSSPSATPSAPASRRT